VCMFVCVCTSILMYVKCKDVFCMAGVQYATAAYWLLCLTTVLLRERGKHDARQRSKLCLCYLLYSK